RTVHWKSKMTEKTATGYGYGKTILLGEHFVVQGLPAIAAGLNKTTICRIEQAPKFEVADNRPETPGYKVEKREQQKQAHELIFRKLGIDPNKTPFRIILEGELIAISGVGASAADCVSTARALNGFFNLGLDDDAINDAGFAGEKAYAGTPSGIDNTVSTFGGTIWFQKGTPPLVEKIHTDLKLYIVLIDSGKTSDTQTVVADVKRLKDAKPEWFAGITKQYERLASEARNALVANDLKKFAQQMNANHQLLQQITVSNKDLDAIVDSALNSGALAAKMTGTGRGGLVIALCKDSNSQSRVASEVQKKTGFTTQTTTIGK
ncbi:MAG: mevalonate kinase, partial [Candidatus Diapherotrites archaeon]|nr:mevalonate kinase [Candidatus Diapherotrites archaeon]